MSKIKTLFVLMMTAVIMAGVTMPAYAEMETQQQEDETDAIEDETVDPDDCEDYEDLVYYVNDDNTIKIVSCYQTDTNAVLVKNVEVPAEIDGKKVTQIEKNCFRELSDIETITLPDTIEEIGKSAFYSCEGLKSVNMPANLKTLGEAAFYNCMELSTLSFGKDIEEIEPNSFVGCVDLKSITVDEENETYSSKNGILFNKDETEIIKCPDDYSDGEFVIPAGVTSLGNYSFFDCHNITAFDFSESNVTSIGNEAFYNCTSLKTLTLPNTLTTLPEGICGYCTSLKSVVIPDSITVIGGYDFVNCTSLKKVTLPSNLTEIQTYAFFDCTSLKKLKVPDSVTSIYPLAVGYKTNSSQSDGEPVSGFKLVYSKNCTGAVAYAQTYEVDGSGFDISSFYWLFWVLGVVLVLGVFSAIILLTNPSKKNKTVKYGSNNNKENKENK